MTAQVVAYNRELLSLNARLANSHIQTRLANSHIQNGAGQLVVECIGQDSTRSSRLTPYPPEPGRGQDGHRSQCYSTELLGVNRSSSAITIPRVIVLSMNPVASGLLTNPRRETQQRHSVRQTPSPRSLPATGRYVGCCHDLSSPQLSHLFLPKFTLGEVIIGNSPRFDPRHRTS